MKIYYITIEKMTLARIEIPFGSNVKYEFEDDILYVDRILSTSMVYPGNYGFIPKTLADDGDPIDILIILAPAFFPGSFVQCKVLGMLVTEDEKGFDQKVIAVPDESIDASLSHLNNIDDLNEMQLNIIKDFFAHYKVNEPEKWVKVYEFEGREETLELIESKTFE